MNPTGLSATPSTSTFVTSGAVLLLAQACRWRAPDATVALADHAVRLARSENRVENALLAEAWLAHGLVVIGHGATAAPRAASALAEATRVGATAAAGRLRVELATIARTVDATEQAQRLLDPVLASSDVEPLLRADASLEAAMGAAREVPESRELLDVAVRALSQLGGEEGELGLAHVDALAASRARVEGRLTESVKRARDGLTRSLGNSMTGGALEPVSPHLTTLLCYELCQALVANGHPEPVQDISRPILGWAVRPGSLVPAARLHLLLASAVQRPAGAFEDALASATWVAEAIESRDLPELEAHCQTVLGEIWDSSGNLSQAVRATRQAHLAHRAHTERINQVRALLVQVAGGTLAHRPSGRSEGGRTGRPSDPRALGRRVVRKYTDDDSSSPVVPSGGPTEPPGSPRLPGRPLNPGRDAGRADEPRHGKPANGYRVANGFESGRGPGEVAGPSSEVRDNRTISSRSPGGDLPSGPVDPAFSNEFGASISQFSESGPKTPGDPGPPTLPRGLSGRNATAFGAPTLPGPGPEPTVAPQTDSGGPLSRHGEPDGADRRVTEHGQPPGGRRRRPDPEEVLLEARDSRPEPAPVESPDDDDLPGVLWLAPDTPDAAPSTTTHTRIALTEQELADQLAGPAGSDDARPAHLVVIDISMPDGSRCGPAARTVAERVADQLDGQRPPGARLYLLGDDTVTVSLTDADPQTVNRWLRTVSGGISRRWTTLAAELPTVATFRIVVRPLDPRWSMREHLAEVRARLHPGTDAGQPRTERASTRGERDQPPTASEPENHTSRRDSSHPDDSSGWDRAVEREDQAVTGNRESEPRSRHSVGGPDESEQFPTGDRRWLSAAPGSGGRRRRPEPEPEETAAFDTQRRPLERDPLTDPDPFGMSSASTQRPVSRRDSAAVADHAHPDGWPIDDEPDGPAGPDRTHDRGRLGQSDRDAIGADPLDGAGSVAPAQLTVSSPSAESGESERSATADNRPELPASPIPELDTQTAVEGGLGAPRSADAAGPASPLEAGGVNRADGVPGSAEPHGSMDPARADDHPEPGQTDTEPGWTLEGGRRQRGKTEISTLAMEAVAPPGSSHDGERAGIERAEGEREEGEQAPEPERPPARNWDRPVSELSFAELIDGALAAYREA